VMHGGSFSSAAVKAHSLPFSHRCRNWRWERGASS